jgi:hypothetical protein
MLINKPIKALFYIILTKILNSNQKFLKASFKNSHLSPKNLFKKLFALGQAWKEHTTLKSQISILQDSQNFISTKMAHFDTMVWVTIYFHSFSFLNVWQKFYVQNQN